MILTMARSWVLGETPWAEGMHPKGGLGTFDVPGFLAWIEIGHPASLALVLGGGGGRPALPDPTPSAEAQKPKRRKRARDTDLVYTALFEPPKGSPE